MTIERLVARFVTHSARTERHMSDGSGTRSELTDHVDVAASVSLLRTQRRGLAYGCQAGVKSSAGSLVRLTSFLPSSVIR